MTFSGLHRISFLLLLLPAGCTTGQVKEAGYAMPAPATLRACYGYSCRYSAAFPVTPAVADRFAAIMAAGAGSPDAERAAVSAAVQYYEELSAGAIGARDQPRSPVVASGEKGQMDCIDESTNTRGLLLYLDQRRLLRHHALRPNTSRGLLLDGRYPHWTAVLRDSSGKDWAVDSWFEAAGGPPDIVPLSYWRTRGVLGER